MNYERIYYSIINRAKGKNIPIRNNFGLIYQTKVDRFQVASIVAITVLLGEIEDNTKGATHFHNPHTSKPVWRPELKRTMRIRNYDFYKLPPVWVASKD